MRVKKIIIGVLCAVVFLLGFFTYFFYRIPEGEYIGCDSSPEGMYKINIYLCYSSLSDDAVRCECETVATSKRRNIYYEYHKKDADIEWVDETTAIINGRQLNILTDKYDWRHDKDWRDPFYDE